MTIYNAFGDLQIGCACDPNIGSTAVIGRIIQHRRIVFNAELKDRSAAVAEQYGVSSVVLTRSLLVHNITADFVIEPLSLVAQSTVRFFERHELLTLAEPRKIVSGFGLFV